MRGSLRIPALVAFLLSFVRMDLESFYSRTSFFLLECPLIALNVWQGFSALIG